MVLIEKISLQKLNKHFKKYFTIKFFNFTIESKHKDLFLVLSRGVFKNQKQNKTKIQLIKVNNNAIHTHQSQIYRFDNIVPSCIDHHKHSTVQKRKYLP